MGCSLSSTNIDHRDPEPVLSGSKPVSQDFNSMPNNENTGNKSGGSNSGLVNAFGLKTSSSDIKCQITEPVDNNKEMISQFSNEVENRHVEAAQKKFKTPQLSGQRESKSKKQSHELEIKELMEKNNQATKVINQHEAELHKREQKIQRLKAKSKGREETLQTSINDLKNENEDLKNKIEKQISSSKQKLEKSRTKHKQKVDRLIEDAARLKQEIAELTQANDDLKNRLSAVFGAKLQDNNPQIADLSDQNRATKLAEQFSELYDNDWTNCFEVLTKQKNINEKEAIGQMLQACLTIYNDCSTHASNDLQTLRQTLERFDAETDIRLVKDLKEKRKRRFQGDIKRLRQPIEEKIITIFKDSTNETTVAKFWLKCMELCWLMVIQDPPVSMDARTSHLGEVFDLASYRPYTQSGKYIEFIVWPTLRLTENGPLLYKGVAQGADTLEQYSDCVDTAVLFVERNRSKVSHEPLNKDTSKTLDEVKKSPKISSIGFGTNVLENKEEHNTRNSQQPADQNIDKQAVITDDSAASGLPVEQAINHNKAYKKSNSNTDDRTNVNVKTFDTQTQPASDEIQWEDSLGELKPEQTQESNEKGSANSIEDNMKPHEKRKMASSDAKEKYNEKSKRNTTVDENNQRGRSRKQKGCKNEFAKSSKPLAADNKNQDNNVTIKQMSKSLRGTTDSDTGDKKITTIQIKLDNANNRNQSK
ncbi:uncharacterized protein LOC127877920 [Dreissena polymorpha]|uniref:Mitochondria-eating protein C-terminal domain-containing protein n=1 Tax=Dreissena polymorpha TaxID=45954 RepID=A0A9D4KFI7_DREPO|nr:uncharacterized protein LOC127877920 [Dreissena polymorpha]KAH3838955.1 hypothetical protein DPMN_112373 [Dreissena polymorpha]